MTDSSVSQSPNTYRAKLTSPAVILALCAAVIFVATLFLAACSKPFSIEGSWKNTGDTEMGQMYEGAIISFDGSHCNVYSPYDTYGFSKDNDGYHLDVTGALSGNISFDVDVKDNDHIELKTSSKTIELTRVN